MIKREEIFLTTRNDKKKSLFECCWIRFHHHEFNAVIQGDILLHIKQIVKKQKMK